MKKFIWGFVAALFSGLLFCCVDVEASDILPAAGFQKWESEIEPIEPTYIVTDEEADLLVRIGCLEGGADVEGIANVIQVVMNRVASDKFPNTISEVIFQNNPVQFTTADKLADANVVPEAYEALDAVIFGEYQDNDCHFFESLEGLAFSGWSDYSFSYGGHDFYKVR